GRLGAVGRIVGLNETATRRSPYSIGPPPEQQMMRDVRYALRVLKNNPGFTATAALTLALGIGLNTTIFSIFDGLALRPVPLPGPTPALTIYEDMRGDV